MLISIVNIFFHSNVKLFLTIIGGSVKLITIDEIIKANDALNKLTTQRWFSQELFTIRWWGLAGFLVLSYVLCFKLLDKKRLVELLLYGSLVSVFSVVLDIYIENRNLFLYKARLIPIIPSIFIYDITALPLYFMVLYQHAATWKKYSIWITLVSLLLGYIFTPLMVKLGYLQLINWSYTKAFLVIIFVGFLAKAVVSLILYVQEKNLQKS
jgi:hypothetical protein